MQNPVTPHLVKPQLATPQAKADVAKQDSSTELNHGFGKQQAGGVLLRGLFAIALVLIAALCIWYWFFPQHFFEVARDAERNRAGLERQQLSVADETWTYLAGGNTEGQTLVLLHGFAVNKDNWPRFASHFTEQYRVIAPDLPGFGESARHPGWRYDTAAQAQRLDEFFTALGLDKFHIAGNSMGGNIAAYYTAQYPQRVLSLGLVNNAGVAAPQKSDMQLAAERGENPLLVESPADYEQMLAYAMAKPPYIPGQVKKLLAEEAMQHRDFNEYIFNQYRQHRSSGLEPLLPQIKQPVFILWGKLDRLIHVSSIETMRPLLQNETVVVFDDIGHAPMIEAPKRSAAAYQNFLTAEGF